MGEPVRRHLDTIAECLSRIPADLANVNRLELDGVLHNVQVSADAAMDLAALLVSRRGHVVQDDYHNLETLQENGVLPPDVAEGLRRLNGLRNAIVHKYNKFEEGTGRTAETPSYRG